LEDFVPSDRPARFIRKFVDSLDLKALGFGLRELEEGRPNYAADLLLTETRLGRYGCMDILRVYVAPPEAGRRPTSNMWLCYG